GSRAHALRLEALRGADGVGHVPAEIYLFPVEAVRCPEEEAVGSHREAPYSRVELIAEAVAAHGGVVPAVGRRVEIEPQTGLQHRAQEGEGAPPRALVERADVEA